MDNNNIDKMSCDNSSDHIKVIEDTNSIYFNGGITPKSMSSLIEILLFMENRIIKTQKKFQKKINEIKNKKRSYDEYIEDQFNIKIEPKPINLYITSNGGYVYQVFSVIDTIKAMKVPIHTICKGFVASAGTLLSLSGSKRYITKNSYMLIHELRSGQWGKFTYLSESFDNCKQLMDHIKSFYLEKTKMTSEELDEQLKKDICWNAQICLEKGLVDEIIE